MRLEDIRTGFWYCREGFQDNLVCSIVIPGSPIKYRRQNDDADMLLRTAALEDFAEWAQSERANNPATDMRGPTLYSKSALIPASTRSRNP